MVPLSLAQGTERTVSTSVLRYKVTLALPPGGNILMGAKLLILQKLLVVGGKCKFPRQILKSRGGTTPVSYVLVSRSSIPHVEEIES